MYGQGSLFHPLLSSTTKNYFSFRHIIRLIQSNPMFLPVQYTDKEYLFFIFYTCSTLVNAKRGLPAQ